MSTETKKPQSPDRRAQMEAMAKKFVIETSASGENKDTLYERNFREFDYCAGWKGADSNPVDSGEVERLKKEVRMHATVADNQAAELAAERTKVETLKAEIELHKQTIRMMGKES